MRQLAALTLVMFLGACSWGPSMPSDDKLPTGDQGGHQKVGSPYKVAGKWYYPAEDPDYDVVGYASWYGSDFHGKRTANGEMYNMNALTAAHKTLPLPSYVKVTNLSNGRTLVLRVNDRGPFVKSRILDVSRRAAQLLGFDKKGVTKVRVQACDEHGKLHFGRRHQEPDISRPVDTAQMTVPVVTPDPKAAPVSVPLAAVTEAPLAAPPAASPSADTAPVTAAALHYVQVGAYSSQANAASQVERLRREGFDARLEATTLNGNTIWRVRIGPYSDRTAAQRSLDRVLSDGFYGARIFTESSR